MMVGVDSDTGASVRLTGFGEVGLKNLCVDSDTGLLTVSLSWKGFGDETGFEKESEGEEKTC